MRMILEQLIKNIPNVTSFTSSGVDLSMKNYTIPNDKMYIIIELINTHIATAELRHRYMKSSLQL